MATSVRIAWSFTSPSLSLSLSKPGCLLKVIKASSRTSHLRPLSIGRELSVGSLKKLPLGCQFRTRIDWKQRRQATTRQLVTSVIAEKSQTKSKEEIIRENIPRRTVGQTYHSFKLLRDDYIPDIDSVVRLYAHSVTGAQLVSVLNREENKTFGVVFRTPPSNSRGTPHILEHSVLCGSRKYPVKEPFVELMKSSLNTFLNAFTFPDKTCYPVASCNLQDFYNLLDVYLDAVFYPNLTPDVFKQEGHHFEATDENSPITIQGVVYNEMKGVFSNPDSVMGSLSQRCLFPENTYGVESGGDPREIPYLSWNEFDAFYKQLYHPSNTRFWFYGDDPEDRRLQKLEEYLKDFKHISVDSQVKLQSRWSSPRRFEYEYDSGKENLEKKHMATVNWLLTEVTADPVRILALSVLDHLLIGTSASPLRKALIDSELGEDVIGSGLETELRQATYSIGLKGMKQDGPDKLHKVVLDTLNRLAKDGFSQGEIDSSMNTIEFMLKEQNTGSFPKGLALMLRSLTTWLHDEDPFLPLKFEAPLQSLKKQLHEDKSFLGNLIREYFLDNRHEAFVVLSPDSEYAAKERERESKLIEDYKKTLDATGLKDLIAETKRLKEKQVAPDDPADLAKVPALKKSDVNPKITRIPRDIRTIEDTTILCTPLFTNDIVYLDLAIDIRQIPANLLNYIPLFAECLLELGTTKEDFVSLQQRIGRETGGIRHSIYCSQMVAPNDHGGFGPAVAQLIIRGKAVAPKTVPFLDILRDVLFDVDWNNRERFRQILIEEKSGVESGIGPAGHRVAAARLNAQYTSSGWADEQMGGISYLRFLNQLLKHLDSDWDQICSNLKAVQQSIIARSGMTLNITTDSTTLETSVISPLSSFLRQLPQKPLQQQNVSWETDGFEAIKRNEGIIIPSTVNYVGKGTNLFQLGYQPTGASLFAMKYLGISYLWERIRVQGGAYGAFCKVDPRTGQLVFLSYRDPHVKRTLDTYDDAADFLSKAQLSEEQLERCIIGVIGDMDSYQLPDAKGFTSLVRYLSGVSEELLQQRRDEVLSASNKDLRDLGEVLNSVKHHASIVVVGSEEALQQSNAEGLNLVLFRATEDQ